MAHTTPEDDDGPHSDVARHPSGMKPRAIVFDLFGDHLRYHGGAARLQSLTELLEVFGIGESTTRVVLARMRREGWFETHREGRQTVYSLTGTSWQLLDDGRTRIFDRQHGPWDGQWRMVIYGAAERDRADRDRLRRCCRGWASVPSPRPPGSARTRGWTTWRARWRRPRPPRWTC